ncbi:MAG: helix-turn-helix transcriptional regulator [Tepidisphaeraceae bacterium]
MSYTRSRSAPARRRKRTSGSRGRGSRKSSGNGRLAQDEPIQVTPSSGNVFLDLGYSPEEAANLRARSELMMQVHKEIKRRELTQARAARLFGVTQPRISDLIRGKIGRFSVDMLIGMLGRAGVDVQITVGPKAA